MALRWRQEGTLLCAAKSSEEYEDTYIDDRLHLFLDQVLKVIEPDENEEENGIWHWLVDEDTLLYLMGLENTNENGN